MKHKFKKNLLSMNKPWRSVSIDNNIVTYAEDDTVMKEMDICDIERVDINVDSGKAVQCKITSNFTNIKFSNIYCEAPESDTYNPEDGFSRDTITTFLQALLDHPNYNGKVCFGKQKHILGSLMFIFGLLLILFSVYAFLEKAIVHLTIISGIVLCFGVSLKLFLGNRETLGLKLK